MTGLLGGLGFLVLGILELVVLQRTLYPALRWRHEKAKLTQSQGVRPGVIITLLRVQSLIVMPVLGFLLGHRLADMIGYGI